jgi:hypothetical protein
MTMHSPAGRVPLSSDIWPRITLFRWDGRQESGVDVYENLLMIPVAVMMIMIEVCSDGKDENSWR